MRLRLLLIFIVATVVLSCQTKEGECKNQILDFLSLVEESEFQHLYGFSAESNWGKRDANGDRRVYRMLYINEYKQRFEFPSFQEFEGSSYNQDKSYDFKKLAIELNQYDVDEEKMIRNYAEQIVGLINKYDLKGINSQRHLGDVVEFVLLSGCSIHYKKDAVILSDGYKKAFQNGYEIMPNWYILDRNSDTQKLINLFASK